MQNIYVYRKYFLENNQTANLTKMVNQFSADRSLDFVFEGRMLYI